MWPTEEMHLLSKPESCGHPDRQEIGSVPPKVQGVQGMRIKKIRSCRGQHESYFQNYRHTLVTNSVMANPEAGTSMTRPLV